MRNSTVVALAGDPFVGTWKMNAAKSKFSYPPPKSFTETFTAQDNGVKLVQDVVEADGKTIHRTLDVKYDGKDYPVKAPDVDTVSTQKPNANTTDYAFKKDGKVVFKGQAVVSKDGKTYTDVGEGKGEKGQAFTYTFIMEKQ